MRLDQNLLDAIEIFGIADLLLIDPIAKVSSDRLRKKPAYAGRSRAFDAEIVLLRLEPGLDSLCCQSGLVSRKTSTITIERRTARSHGCMWNFPENTVARDNTHHRIIHRQIHLASSSDN